MTPDELDTLAKELHHEWDSPELLPRIAAAARTGPNHVARFGIWVGAVAAMAVVGLYLIPRPPRDRVPVSVNAPLLDEDALAEVEATEGVYRRSIDRLAGIASTKLSSARSPFMNAYVEKLALLDAAIGVLRSEIDRNRFNTNLRLQVAALYRDKQQTLEQVIHHE